MSYWVVVNHPTAAEAHVWTPEHAIRMIIGKLDRKPPMWAFNPPTNHRPPSNIQKVREDDSVLLYNGAYGLAPSQSFLAFAQVKEVVSLGDDHRLLLKGPMGVFGTPVSLTRLQMSKNPRILEAPFARLFSYHHGPLDNLGSYPGRPETDPERGARRYAVIMEAGSGELSM
jgi:hypothetical protein